MEWGQRGRLVYSHKLELLFFIIYGLRSTQNTDQGRGVSGFSSEIPPFGIWSEQSEAVLPHAYVGGGAIPPMNFPHDCYTEIPTLGLC